MKKQVLIGTVLLAAMSAFPQTGSKVARPVGMVNVKQIADMKYGPESAPAATQVSPVKPTAFPNTNSGSKTTAANWKSISASMNIYGVIISFAKPLQWNDELNTVSFVHRKSPSYVINPAPASTAANGNMEVLISMDCGATWDSTALYTNDNFWGRYPNGAIYNPPGNTDINNAYIVGAGPTTGAGAVTWIGNWYASKKLGAANYNNTPSTAPGAQQVMPTAGPFAAGFPSRHDFAAYNFSATDDGKMRVLAGITDDATQSDTAVMLVTGVFNSSTNTFDWSGKVFDPPTTEASDGTENWNSRPMMAWNEQGTVGYLVVMGQRLGTTGSNTGLQPIVYKTTNSGGTWSLENGINFNDAANFGNVTAKLWPINQDPNLNVPNFLWLEGHDCSVDYKDRLHIFTSLVGQSSNDPDSTNFISQWNTTERYLWPHAPIKDDGPAIHPYLYDFVYDGTNTAPTWSYMLIDSMSSEGVSGLSNGGGYQDNPWDMDPTQSNQKVRIDARLQMSRTPDGKNLLYSWSESDTNYTDQQKKWNNLPNIKARFYDVEKSILSPTEINVTETADGEVANRAMYHFISPKFKLDSKDTWNADISIPMTVSNSNPYSQLTANTHWYTCAGLRFELSTVGIDEKSKALDGNSSIYPNPARNNATVNVNLVNTSKVQIQVMNTVGQVVRTISAQGQVGNNAINVDLSGLSSGIYLVNIKADQASSTKKLVIE